MIFVACCECNKVYSLKFDQDTHSFVVSHGVCEKCYKKAEEEINKFFEKENKDAINVPV